MTASLAAWMADLEARHLSALTFAEVGRALRALSSAYVERRERLASKGAFDSAGKRAAYALYYAPLHFVTVAEIVRALGAAPPVRLLLDLGCGTGAAGAAWAAHLPLAPRVLGIDTHPWAIGEAARTYRAFGLEASARRADAGRVVVPRHADAIVAGWMLNEVDEGTRAVLQEALLTAVRQGLSCWWSSRSRRACRRGGTRVRATCGRRRTLRRVALHPGDPGLRPPSGPRRRSQPQDDYGALALCGKGPKASYVRWGLGGRRVMLGGS